MIRVPDILVLLFLAAVFPKTLSSRDIRSPGGSGWQQSGRFAGGPSIDVARSSSAIWSGSGFGGSHGAYGARSGWSGTSGYGANARSSGGNYPSSNGWANGPSSSVGYGRNTYSTNSGWTGGSDEADSIATVNGWDGSRLGALSNNGWQSSAW